MSKAKKESNRTGQLELPVFMDVATSSQTFAPRGKEVSSRSHISETEKELLKEMDAKSARYVW